jgi:hypothetical protein
MSQETLMVAENIKENTELVLDKIINLALSLKKDVDKLFWNHQSEPNRKITEIVVTAYYTVYLSHISFKEFEDGIKEAVEYFNNGSYDIDTLKVLHRNNLYYVSGWMDSYESRFSFNGSNDMDSHETRFVFSSFNNKETADLLIIVLNKIHTKLKTINL